VFPFFLFIVGVAITLSPAKRNDFAPVLRRGLTIFALGLFLAGFPFFNLSTWRIPGVLQRIAVCYVAAVFVMRLLGSQTARHRAMMVRILLSVAAILVAYSVVMLLVPVPGGRAGDLSPAGNMGAWLDRLLMKGHLWRPDWDPEGLLSTLPALATTLLGVVTGLARQTAPNRAAWIRQLTIGGAIGVALGAAWHPWLPINKSLWTGSYVLFTAGAGALGLALCSWWVDDRRERWRIVTSEPFVALGRNAILLFVLSGLIGRLLGIIMIDQAARVTLKTWIYTSWFTPLASPKNASLLFALANLALLYALLAWLHRRRLYWRA
jgi:predicted acyltransferase